MNLVKKLWLLFDKVLVAWFAQIVMFVFLKFEETNKAWWLGPWTNLLTMDLDEIRIREESWSQSLALFLVLTVPGVVSYLIYNNIKKVSPGFLTPEFFNGGIEGHDFHKELSASEKASIDAALVVIEDNKDLAPFREKLRASLNNQTWTGEEIANAFAIAFCGWLLIGFVSMIFGFALFVDRNRMI